MVNIEVPSVDEYSAKVEKLGGKIIVPKEAVPGMGYFVICMDTANNTFGIWEMNPTAKYLTREKEPMATIADFVGTWYLGGDRTKPCHISLDGTHLTVSIGCTNYQDYSFNGNNEIYRGGYPTGFLSSDLKRIDWTFAETFWER